MPCLERGERSSASDAQVPGGGSFPRQQARTQRFILGRPRGFTVSPDGSRVVFLRSFAGDDSATGLWVLDLPGARERLVFDPRSRDAGETELPPEELARRERVRERAGGVVAYSTDRAVTVAAFSVGGRLFVADLLSGESRELPAVVPVFDPRIDPTGRCVAYVAARALRVIELEGEDRVLAADDDPDESWGLAEFVAAEEMDRAEGFWWSPDGSRLAAARVDEGRVTTWHIFDAVDPDGVPRAVRYPAAGTPNADVSLHVLGLDGSRVEVQWDRVRFEYLARVVWSEGTALTLLVQSRDQRLTRILTVGERGETSLVREDRDWAWVELVPGSPAWTEDGRLVCTVDADDTRRLVVDGTPVTPPGLQVRRIIHADAGVIFGASEDPTEEHVWRWSPDGAVERLTEAPGVHDAAAEGDVLVITSATLKDAPTTTVYRRGEVLATIASRAETPVVEAKPTFFLAGTRELRAALLLPGGREPEGSLPVLLDPYGGPGFQRVVRARDRFLESQWFADQGFAVLAADGRGTPGRGTAWERAVYRDLTAPPLEDQIDALHAAAERFPFIDLGRVAIRGWSFGGHLAVAAVLRHPEVFHAAVAGAPGPDPRLYDTHYTERYLGHPDEEPEVYRRESLIDDAWRLERPILLIHGLADDNVFVANSLRLSRAFLEAGRPHTFLPLSGASHMAKEEVVAENLLLLELRFLRDALVMETD
ncbi:MAG: prolyl oligopeptidase family serine peptidase [Actinomycetota bacterium]|nr:prolyl oligopeptidase family serine peptidase [Actinomycetota bacterium]